jgi:V8-like Glu-specific endopeptidase
MGWRQCFFAFVLATTACSTALGAIFDKDDRTLVDTRENPALSAIGKVSAGLRQGTGFLISECHVLTVRHIFGGGKQPLGRKASFRITVPAIGYLRSKGAVIASGKLANEGNDRSDDWALIQLDSCLGRTVGYFDIMSHLALIAHYATGPVRIAGFPGSDAALLVMDPACSIHHGTDLEWFHDCATLRGSSGSPVFRQIRVGDHEELRVLGMQTSGFHSTAIWSYDPRIANRATRIDFLASAVVPYLPRVGAIQIATDNKQWR